MYEILVALGRGIVKTLISVFIGAGVGLVTFGSTVSSAHDYWHRPGPPPEMFLAIGAGMLSTGAMLVALFLIPRMAKPSQLTFEKGEPVET